jgi:hypothetical protein
MPLVPRYCEAPSAVEFHKECTRKTTRLHQWDVLRANKAGLYKSNPVVTHSLQATWFQPLNL